LDINGIGSKNELSLFHHDLRYIYGPASPLTDWGGVKKSYKKLAQLF